jgi:hypothetical protein
MTGLTLASTHNVNVGISEDECLGRFESSDLRWWVLFIPVQGIPDVKEATDRVLEQGKGNLMLNATLYYQGYGLPPILGVNGYVVKGDIYMIKDKIHE